MHDEQEPVEPIHPRVDAGAVRRNARRSGLVAMVVGTGLLAALAFVAFRGHDDGDSVASGSQVTDESVAGSGATTSSSTTTTPPTTGATTTTSAVTTTLPATAPPTKPTPAPTTPALTTPADPGVYIGLSGPADVPHCSEYRPTCYWIVGSIVGYPTAVDVQCSVDGTAGTYNMGPVSPTGWGPGVCRVSAGLHTVVWAVVELADNTSVVSNTIVVP